MNPFTIMEAAWKMWHAPTPRYTLGEVRRLIAKKGDALPSVDVHGERCSHRHGDIIDVDGQPHRVRRVIWDEADA